MKQYLKTRMRKILTVFLAAIMALPILPAEKISAENTITTDRDTYEVGDPVYVTASAGADVLEQGAWVSLLKEEDDPATAWSYYWYYVDGYDEETGLSWRNGQTYNIFTDAVNSKRNKEDYANRNLPAGDYKLVMMYGSVPYTVVSSKSIRITEGTTPEGLSMYKTVFTGDEAVEVTAVSHDTAKNPWVGLYEGTYTAQSTFGSDYLVFYYLAGNNGTKDLRDLCLLENGDYSIAYFKDNTYSDVYQVLNFTVSGYSVPDTEFSLPKDHFRYQEEIPLSWSSPHITDNAWIGLYDYDAVWGSTPSLSYAYLRDIDSPVNYLADVHLPYGKTYPVPGHYKFTLSKDGGFNCDTVTATGKEAILDFYVDRVYRDPEWTWNGIDSAAALFTGTDPKSSDADYRRSVNASVTLSEDVAATCTEDGHRTYTARVDVSFPTESGKSVFSDGKTVTVEKLGHNWGEWTVVRAATETAEGLERRICLRDGSHVEERVIPALTHTHDLRHVEGKAASCEEAGNREYWVCEDCGRIFEDREGKKELDADSLILPALGHDYTDWVYDEKTHTHTKTCLRDSSHFLREDCTYEKELLDGGIRYTCTVCQGEHFEELISTDKKEYKLYESIMVSVNVDALADIEGYDPDTAWVGLYRRGDTTASHRFFYIRGRREAVDLLYDEPIPEGDLYGPGEYRVYLLLSDKKTDGDYPRLAYTDITVSEEAMPADPIVLQVNGVLRKDRESLEIKEDDELIIRASTGGNARGAWIGFYFNKGQRIDHDFDFSKEGSDEFYYLQGYNGVDYKPKRTVSGEAVRDVTIVVFGDSLYGDVRTIVYVSIRKEGTAEIVVEPTCTSPGVTKYTYADGSEYLDINYPPALGHDLKLDSWDWVEDGSHAVAVFHCVRCGEEIRKEAAITSIQEGDIITYTAVVKDNGIEYTDTLTRKAEEDPVIEERIIRLSGSDRYETSIKAAEELKDVLDTEQFDTVILSTGKQFADALGGGYLAAKKNAPILLTQPNKANLINTYIQENLKAGGIIYVLGGEAAVPKECLTGLEDFEIRRLSGKTRYDTNLAILEEAGVDKEDILICTGQNYADSLSASATGLPMLLVNGERDSLNAGQRSFLSAHPDNAVYLIGGTGALSEKIEAEVLMSRPARRLSGRTRNLTSLAIARAFCQDPKTAVLAYSQNFPDGLCAGPLAYALDAPVILTQSGAEGIVKDYVQEEGISSGYVTGGEKALSDGSIRLIFSLADNAAITKR